MRVVIVKNKEDYAEDKDSKITALEDAVKNILKMAG